MASSLSNLVNNLAERVHKIKCNNGHDNKKREMFVIKYKDCECCRKYMNMKDDSTVFKCLRCNRKLQKKFNENLKKRFVDTYKFSSHDINKFILFL